MFNYLAFINALFADEFNCTLCRNLLAQIEKQLKLILFSLRLQLNPGIACIAYLKQMHNQKTNTHEHINHIHRETTPVMKLNQNFILLIQHIYMGVFHSFLCMLFSSECLILAYVTIIQSGCLYPFSLLPSKIV